MREARFEQRFEAAGFGGDAAGDDDHATPSNAFCRRRWTELPIPIASRYFATVRRAMPKPLALSMSTSVSSDRIALASSAVISARIADLTASADTASPPS